MPLLFVVGPWKTLRFVLRKWLSLGAGLARKMNHVIRGLEPSHAIGVTSWQGRGLTIEFSHVANGSINHIYQMQPQLKSLRPEGASLSPISHSNRPSSLRWLWNPQVLLCLCCVRSHWWLCLQWWSLPIPGVWYQNGTAVLRGYF